jgi:hypothetical protein
MGAFESHHELTEEQRRALTKISGKEHITKLAELLMCISPNVHDQPHELFFVTRHFCARMNLNAVVSGNFRSLFLHVDGLCSMCRRPLAPKNFEGARMVEEGICSAENAEGAAAALWVFRMFYVELLAYNMKECSDEQALLRSMMVPLAKQNGVEVSNEMLVDAARRLSRFAVALIEIITIHGQNGYSCRPLRCLIQESLLTLMLLLVGRLFFPSAVEVAESGAQELATAADVHSSILHHLQCSSPDVSANTLSSFLSLITSSCAIVEGEKQPWLHWLLSVGSESDFVDRNAVIYSNHPSKSSHLTFNQIGSSLYFVMLVYCLLTPLFIISIYVFSSVHTAPDQLHSTTLQGREVRLIF